MRNTFFSFLYYFISFCNKKCMKITKYVLNHLSIEKLCYRTFIKKLPGPCIHELRYKLVRPSIHAFFTSSKKIHPSIDRIITWPVRLSIEKKFVRSGYYVTEPKCPLLNETVRNITRKTHAHHKCLEVF